MYLCHGKSGKGSLIVIDHVTKPLINTSITHRFSIDIVTFVRYVLFFSITYI